MRQPAPARGELWWVNLDPVAGHEQGGRRPALVLSADIYNRGASDLVVVIPATTRDRGIPLHVRIEPPKGGVQQPTVLLCDHIRSLARSRLAGRIGAVSPAVLAEVEERIAALLFPADD